MQKGEECQAVGYAWKVEWRDWKTGTEWNVRAPMSCPQRGSVTLTANRSMTDWQPTTGRLRAWMTMRSVARSWTEATSRTSKNCRGVWRKYPEKTRGLRPSWDQRSTLFHRRRCRRQQGRHGAKHGARAPPAATAPAATTLDTATAGPWTGTFPHPQRWSASGVYPPAVQGTATQEP